MKSFKQYLNEKFLTISDCKKAYAEGVADGSIGKCPECGSPNLDPINKNGSRHCVDCGTVSDQWRIKEEDGAGAPTNNAGSGNIAGIGINRPGDPNFAEPGVPVRKKLEIVGPPPTDPRMFRDK